MNSIELKKALKMLKSATDGVSFQDRIVYMEFVPAEPDFLAYLKLSIQGSMSRGEVTVFTDKIKKEGTCYADLDILYKIVSGCNEQELSLSIDDNKQLLIVKYGRSRFKIAHIEHSQTEINQEFKDEREVNPKKIVEATRQIAAYCDPTSSYETLKGFFLTEDICCMGNSFRVVASKSNPFEEDFFIYYNTIEFLQQISGVCYFSSNDNFITFFSDNFSFIFDINRTMEAPQIRSFLDLPMIDSLEVPFEQLKSLASSISIVNGEDIVLESDGKSLKFECQGINSDFKSALDAKFKKTFKWNLNSHMFKEAIRVIGMNAEKDEGVKIELFEEVNDPCIVLTSGNFVQILSTKNE